MRENDKDVAAIVSLIYETIFASKGQGGFAEAPPSDKHATGSLERASLESIVPFLEQALTSARASSDTALEGGSRMTLLEQLPLPVCIVSKKMRLMSATKKARELLELDSALSVVDGVIQAADRTLQSELTRAIRSAIDSSESQALDSVSPGGSPQTFLTAPISWGTGQPAAVLFLNIELGVFDRLSESLIDTYNLTRSEAEVTSHLAQGLSIDEIAEKNGTSVTTVRTQVKRVFAKTGTNRQGELVSHVLNGPAVWLRLVKRNDAHVSTENLDQAQLLELQDGRVLSFASYGPEQGRPVIVFHHLLGSRTERPSDEGLLHRLNLRLIVPERPGVGQSTPMDKRRLSDCAEDIRQLADHLGFERFHVLGFSSGGPHAAVCAALLGDRVVKLGLAASLMPIDEIPEDLFTNLTQRFMTGMARHWPSGMQSLLEIRYKRLLENPAEAMAGFERGGNRADIELLHDPEINRIRLQNVKAGAKVPKRVFASELVLLSQPWGFRLSEIRSPVQIWHGQQDDFFPVEHARAMSSLIPNCHAFFSEDWGHFFLYREWERVLSELVS